MKRGRHCVTLEIPADSEEEAGRIEALVSETTRLLHHAGLIHGPESGLAANHLFTSALQHLQAGADDSMRNVGEDSFGTCEAHQHAPATAEQLSSDSSGAPQRLGPWTCDFCGNLNFEGRAICNMRKCGRRRSDAVKSAHDDAAASEMHAQEENVTAAGNATTESHAERSGSWTCEYCGNLNYGGRTVCNMRKCSRRRADGVQVLPTSVGKPMGIMKPPIVTGGVPGSMMASAMMPMGGHPLVNGMSNGLCAGSMGGVGMSPMPLGMNNICPSNLMPIGVGGGVTCCRSTSSFAMPADAPLGSWACPSCGNINFPTRTFCNRRTCKRQRP